MKKSLKLLTILLVFFVLFIIVHPTNAATSKMNVVNTVTEGDTITVTVSVNAAQWNLTLTANGKALNTWTETVNYKSNLSKTFTASYKTSGTAPVKFTLTGDITDVSQANTEINESKTVTVTAKPTTTKPGNNTGSSSSGNSGSSTTTKTPTFASANKTVYTTGDVNLRASWSTSSSATLVSKGTELKLTGTSTENINGYVWYRVTYNGATKYIASSLITETKPKEEEKSDNKNLSSLTIDKVELSPKFDKNTTEYTATVEDDVTELKINAKAEDSKAKVSIDGNTNLADGENVIKIKVTAENDTTRTYFITVTKGEKAGTTNKNNETLQLSELKIDRVNFEETFKPDQYTYELSLNSYVKNLDITAIPNQEDAKVEITGNEEFKTGKNMVTILLTSADGKQTATYQIEVTVPEEAVEKTKEMSTTTYIIIGVAVAVVIIGAFLFILHIRRKREEEFYYDEDEENDVELRYNPKQAYLDNLEEQEDVEEEAEEVEEVKKSRRKKSDVTLDDFLNTSDEEEETPKRRKGRHSK